MEELKQFEGQRVDVQVVEVLNNSDGVPMLGAVSGLPSVVEGDDYLVEEVEKAERRLEALKKQRMLIVKLTRSYDWVDFQGRAYLTAYGAERLMHFFNISYRIVDKPEVINHEDGHFTVIFRGTFTWGEQSIDEVGIRSSKDPFFSRANGQDLPPHQVRLSDVMKAARANLIARGVASLLGLRGLEMRDVRKLIGDAKTQVVFKKRKGGSDG
jgi:hypothetical protein